MPVHGWMVSEITPGGPSRADRPGAEELGRINLHDSLLVAAVCGALATEAIGAHRLT